jgi:G3E family GTPase
MAAFAALSEAIWCEHSECWSAAERDFQSILLETTGLADPSPIIFTFNTNSLLQDNFRIDSIVCLVDSN